MPGEDFSREFETLERKLDRHEEKLDRLQEAMVSLARMDERMITLFKRTDSYDGEMRGILKRIADLERVAFGRGIFFRWLDRGGVAIIGAVVALAFNRFG